MRQLLFFISFIPFIIINNFLFSQDCFEYFKSCSAYDSKYYKYDDNTSSFFLYENNPVNIDFEAVPGIIYKITICSDSIKVPLHFIIKDIDENVLFDNNNENNTKVFEFSVNNVKKLFIDVSILEKCDWQKSGCSGCIAVIIEKSIKPRTGF